MANAILEQRREQAFPRLSEAQVARLAARGQRLATRAGQVLVEPGEVHHGVFVVLTGSLDVVAPALAGEQHITRLAPGEFSGELSALRGVAGLVRIRVHQGGTVLKLDEKALRDVIQTDAELSEIVMRAFILRRVGLLASAQGEVMLLGSRHSPDTLRLREFLTRNGYPYVDVDLDTDAGVQALLDRFHVTVDDVPVVIGHCGRVFKKPGIAEIADYLDMNPEIETGKVYDVVVVGAGPAGLSAAVYASSEGLAVLVVEALAFGGQAGTSSRIENYLGFPTGISGQALAGRAFVQAQKFGATVNVACQALRLDCSRWPYRIELSGGQVVQARAIVVAAGVQYRHLPIENLQRFVGIGIYYAATHMEAKLCQSEDVVVVGGGNSAGQAAVFLADHCRHVHMLVRAEGLADSMSRYLIRRIEESPRITLHAHTELTTLEGDQRLERVGWRTRDGEVQTHSIGHVFLMTGAVPNTGWLDGCLSLDDKGFIRTAADLPADALASGLGPARRAPHLHETSVPGVFAVGDVRCGSVKRIASAVGEGAICIQFVHRVLGELSVRAAQPDAVAA